MFWYPKKDNKFQHRYAHTTKQVDKEHAPTVLSDPCKQSRTIRDWNALPGDVAASGDLNILLSRISRVEGM